MSLNIPNEARELAWAWYASRDEERYTVGPCATRDEVIRQAADAELGPYDRRPDEPLTFYIIEAAKTYVDLGVCFDADAVMQTMAENLDDNYGDAEDGDSLADEAWTPDQEKDLTAMLEETVRAWQAKHDIVVASWRFDDTRNAETITIPVDALLSGRRETVDAGEG